jgi:hypothetical protein
MKLLEATKIALDIAKKYELDNGSIPCERMKEFLNDSDRAKLLKLCQIWHSEWKDLHVDGFEALYAKEILEFMIVAFPFAR